MSERDEKGTGKHPHKSTEEPYPHREAEGHKTEQREGRSEGGREGGGNESNELKEREYRDEKGEIHHHTRTYQEQHGSGDAKHEKEKSQR